MDIGLKIVCNGTRTAQSLLVQSYAVCCWCGGHFHPLPVLFHPPENKNGGIS
jgi:hypothetical protein